MEGHRERPPRGAPVTGPTPLSPDAPEPPPLTVVSDRVGDHWRHNPDPDDPGPWQCIGGAPDSGDSVAGEARSWAELRKEGPLTVVTTPDAARTVPDRYVVIGDHLVEDTGTCSCGGGTYEPHEQYCGLEPVARIADIVAWAATRPQQATVNLTPTEYAFRSILGTLASLDPVARARVIRDVRARIGEVAEPETRYAAPTPFMDFLVDNSRRAAEAKYGPQVVDPDDDWDPDEDHPR